MIISRRQVLVLTDVMTIVNIMPCKLHGLTHVLYNMTLITKCTYFSNSSNS